MMSNHSSRRDFTTASLYQHTCLFAMERYCHRTSRLYGLVGSDRIMQQVSCESADHLRQLAISRGQDVADGASYGNYAMFNKPLDSIYWKSALGLKAVKAAVDPTNVTGLAGGFKPSLDGLDSNTIYTVTLIMHVTNVSNIALCTPSRDITNYRARGVGESRVADSK